MSTGNLFRTYLEVKAFNIKEQWYILRNYYKNLRFCLIDVSLLFIYLFINPYRISKKFLKKKNSQNIHLYGETPLSTFEKIVRECGILSTDTFLELGSGRGRCALWLSEFVGCSIEAVEWIPSFQKIVSFVSRLFRSKNLKFCSENMFSMDFKDADVIYLYGTCLEDSEIHLLIEKFKKMNDRVKIITISFPLSEYDPSFFVSKKFSVLFPWGLTTCFINQKKKR